MFSDIVFCADCEKPITAEKYEKRIEAEVVFICQRCKVKEIVTKGAVFIDSVQCNNLVDGMCRVLQPEIMDLGTEIKLHDFRKKYGYPKKLKTGYWVK